MGTECTDEMRNVCATADEPAMRTVASEVTKPLNVVMSAGDPDLTAEQIAATGVKRISVGGALSRLALAAFMKGANEMKAGSFRWMRETMPTSELKKVFSLK
jgi:2-methylisocitrate lyase-like PEP mutase family enzyme